MDRFNAMRVFTRIVELGGFAKAADSLQLPRASVTILIKQLEAHLGVQLLQRTTRQVSPTLDGAAYYQRCVSLLADLEETEAVFSTSRRNPRGTLRIDMPSGIGRFIVIPAMPEFTARYPQIELSISEADRFVDLIAEGVDCVLRAGTLGDSALIGRRVATLRQVTCASPAYLRKYGEPKSLAELSEHRAVNYVSRTTAKLFPFEFMVDGQLQEVSIEGALSVFGAEIYSASAVAGLGIIQCPHYRMAELTSQGVMREILPETPPPPMPVSVLYPHNRQMSPRVRVFVDWLAEIFTNAR